MTVLEALQEAETLFRDSRECSDEYASVGAQQYKVACSHLKSVMSALEEGKSGNDLLQAETVICDDCKANHPFEHRCHGDHSVVNGEQTHKTCQCPVWSCIAYRFREAMKHEPKEKEINEA